MVRSLWLDSCTYPGWCSFIGYCRLLSFWKHHMWPRPVVLTRSLPVAYTSFFKLHIRNTHLSVLKVPFQILRVGVIECQQKNLIFSSDTWHFCLSWTYSRLSIRSIKKGNFSLYLASLAKRSPWFFCFFFFFFVFVFVCFSESHQSCQVASSSCERYEVVSDPQSFSRSKISRRYFCSSQDKKQIFRTSNRPGSWAK